MSQPRPDAPEEEDASPEPEPPPPPIPPAPTGFTVAPGASPVAAYAPAAPQWSPWSQPGAAPAPPRTSRLAIAALVLSAIGLAGGLLLLPIVASLAGIVLGHLALGATGRSGGYVRGRWLAIAALILGYAATLFWVAVAIV